MEHAPSVFERLLREPPANLHDEGHNAVIRAAVAAMIANDIDPRDVVTAIRFGAKQGIYALYDALKQYEMRNL